jgi:hypothetical protein
MLSSYRHLYGATEYAVGVSVPSPGASPTPSGDGLAPRAIRRRLLLEEAGEFDREYRRVMSDAMETLDLNPVLEMLRRWELIARMTEHDPEAHRRMLRTAAAKPAVAEDW